MPFDKILENGIIISKNYYIKIIKVIPINYDLKSNLEKEAILNSYKLFLKTCHFNIQILIQSQKENLSKQISQIENYNKTEKNEKIKDLSYSYINFIKNKNEENKSSSKNFYIVIQEMMENKAKEQENKNINESILLQTLKDNYFKIKETLTRCGNIVYEIQTKQEIEDILKSFLNSK